MEDIQYQFLLQTDINDIPRACQANQKYYRHCSTKQFWIDKFEQDRLPLLSNQCNTIECWIDEYNNTANAVDTTDAILNKFKRYSYFTITLTGLGELVTLDDLLTILPVAFVNKHQQFIQDIYNHVNDDAALSLEVFMRNNTYRLIFMTFDNETGEDDSVEESCNKEDIQRILILLLHDYPNIEILNSNSEYYL